MNEHQHKSQFQNKIHCKGKNVNVRWNIKHIESRFLSRDSRAGSDSDSERPGQSRRESANDLSKDILDNFFYLLFHHFKKQQVTIFI